jgi:hypothetical protein
MQQKDGENTIRLKCSAFGPIRTFEEQEQRGVTAIAGRAAL